MNSIYLDNAATTPVLQEVFDSMQEYFVLQYANPSSAYDFAQKARNAIDLARKQAADLIGAEKDEIYFTSGGSEADNWAIKGAADFFRGKRNKIVTIPIEHHAVLNTVEFLKKYGFDVEYIPVDKSGIVDLEKAEKIIGDNTAIVSVMLANNETGALQPVKEIAAMAHNKGAYFHTEAVQAEGHIKIDGKNGIVTINAEKKIDIASGNSRMTLDGEGNKVTISSGQAIEIKATQIVLDAKSTLDLKASGTVTVKADGPANIKGAVVKLN